MSDLQIPHEVVPAPPSDESTLTQWVASWLLEYSNATRSAYLADVVGRPGQVHSAWLPFCSASNLDPVAVTRGHAAMWGRSLEAHGAKSSTVARRLAGASSFYGYGVAEGFVAANPFARLRRPRIDSQAVELGGSAEDVRAVMAVARQHSSMASALVSVLALTGLRISEALAIDVEAIVEVRGHWTVSVIGKGGKERRCVLPPAAMDAIRNALDGRSAGPVFTSGDDGRRCTRQNAAELIARLGRHAGLASKLHPHSFRHSAITEALASGLELTAVQDWVGHSDPRTTRRYQHATRALDADPSYALAGIYA